MAKKRVQVGSIIKGQDGKPDYIKINNDVVLTKGQYINMENKAQKIAGIKFAISKNKLSDEKGNEMIEKAEKMPDFVRFELYFLKDA